jgi:hypothetical protein
MMMMMMMMMVVVVVVVKIQYSFTEVDSYQLHCKGKL